MKKNTKTNPNTKLLLSVLLGLFFIVVVSLAMGGVAKSQESSDMVSPQQHDGFDDIQAPLSGVSDGETGSDRQVEEQGYVVNEVLITYHEQAPILVNDDETGANDLGNIESTFLDRGIAVVTEDLLSVGIDTTDIEIFGGIQDYNTYFVRVNDEFDPLQLSYQLNALPNVDWAQPNYIYQSELAGPDGVVLGCYDEMEETGTIDPCIDHAWHIPNTNLPEALDFVDGKRSHRPIVAVIESSDYIMGETTNGFDIGNHEYDANLWDAGRCHIRPGVYGDCGDNHGRDFTATRNPNRNSLQVWLQSEDDDPSSNDRLQHATRVTSVLAGERNNGLGAYGVYQDGTVMLLRFKHSAALATAIKFAQRNRAKIINGSFSTRGIDYAPDTSSCSAIRGYRTHADGLLHQTIKDFPGLFVSSAGNGDVGADGVRQGVEIGNGNLIIPKIFARDVNDDNGNTCLSALPNLINVAGTLLNDGFHPESNYSETYVKIAAPAVAIVTVDNNKIARYNTGTSVAAPQVAGTAALMLSLYPGLSPTQLISIIHSTGREISSLDGKVAGSKTLDINAAVRRACEMSARCRALMPSTPPPDNRSVASDENYVSHFFPGATFFKTVSVSEDDLSRPSTYRLERYYDLPDRRIPIYRYEVTRTRMVSVRVAHTTMETVPAYNFGWRDVEEPAYNYETRYRSVPVFNYETRQTTCRRYTGALWWRRCAEWNTETVRVAPFYRLEPYQERVAPFTRTVSRWIRVAPFTQQVPVITYTTEMQPEEYTVTRTYSSPRSGSNYRRIEPRYRTEERHEWRPKRYVRERDIIRSGANPDRNVRVDTYHQVSRKYTLTTNYEGRVTQRTSVYYRHSDAFRAAHDRATYHGETTRYWDSILSEIRNARRYDRYEVLGDSSKITVFEAITLLHRDNERLNVIGLSGGGYYTLIDVRDIVERVNNNPDYHYDRDARVRELRRIF